MQTGTQSIEYHASTAEALAFNGTDINGSVHFVVKNLDAALSVKVSTLATFDADSVLSVLGPGEAASFRGIDCDKIFMVATSAGTALVQWWICEV